VLGLVHDNQLVRSVMVAERSRHQPKEMLAVRQLGQDWAAPSFRKPPSLYESLEKRLRAIGQEKSTTGGVGRQVRHTGTFAGASAAHGHQSNKEIARIATAQVKSFFVSTDSLF
jgi:hypothetical protein